MPDYPTATLTFDVSKITGAKRNMTASVRLAKADRAIDNPLGEGDNAVDGFMVLTTPETIQLTDGIGTIELIPTAYLQSYADDPEDPTPYIIDWIGGRFAFHMTVADADFDDLTLLSETGEQLEGEGSGFRGPQGIPGTASQAVSDDALGNAANESTSIAPSRRTTVAKIDSAINTEEQARTAADTALGTRVTALESAEAPTQGITNAEADQKIATHAADDDAHHARYTDAEADARVTAGIATHAADADAHHAKYTDAEALAAVSPTITSRIADHDREATAHPQAFTAHNADSGAHESIRNAITAEETARIADVDAEEAARIAAIVDEATTRANADTALGTRVTALENAPSGGGGGNFGSAVTVLNANTSENITAASSGKFYRLTAQAATLTLTNTESITDWYCLVVVTGGTLMINLPGVANNIQFTTGETSVIKLSGTVWTQIPIRRAPFTEAERASLTAINTITKIKNLLEGLAGDNRLDASAIKNLPEPGDGGQTSAEVDAKIATHAADDDAHHTRYTDAEADARVTAGIATHAADDDAHHARYTDAEARAAAVDNSTLNSVGGSTTVAPSQSAVARTLNVRITNTDLGSAATEFVGAAPSRRAVAAAIAAGKSDFGSVVRQEVRLAWRTDVNFTAADFAGMDAAVGLTGDYLEVPTPPAGQAALGVWIGGAGAQIDSFLVDGDEEKSSTGNWAGAPTAATVDGTNGNWWATALLTADNASELSTTGVLVTLIPGNVASYVDREIAERTEHRLLPEGAAARQVARRNAENNGWEAEDLPDVSPLGTTIHTLMNGLTLWDVGSSGGRVTRNCTFQSGFANLSAYDEILVHVELERRRQNPPHFLGAADFTFRPQSDQRPYPHRVEVGYVREDNEADNQWRQMYIDVDIDGEVRILWTNLTTLDKLTCWVYGYAHNRAADGVGGAGGLSQAQVEALISSHAAIQDAHHPYQQRTFASITLWQAVAAGASAPNVPAAAQFDGNAWSGYGAWSIRNPGAAAGMDVYAVVAEATYLTNAWNVTMQSQPTLIYSAGVQNPFAVQYRNVNGMISATQNAGGSVSIHQRIFNAALGIYSAWTLIADVAIEHDLVLDQRLQVSGSATMGPAYSTPVIILDAYSALRCWVEFLDGNHRLYRASAYDINTDDIATVLQASETVGSQYMLQVVANAPHGQDPGALVRVVDFNTSAYNQHRGWDWHWMFNFVRSAGHNFGAQIRAFNRLYVYRHTAGNFGSQVNLRIEAIR